MSIPCRRDPHLACAALETIRVKHSVPAVLMAAMVLLSVATAWAGWKVGATLPDLRPAGLEGMMATNLAGKVVLVDFWASWCSPCKASFPVLNTLQEKFAAQGLIVLAINEDESADAMKKFLKEHPAVFTVLHDAGHKLVQSAGVESMPTSYLIDRNGIIRFHHNGFHGDKTARQYEEEIQSLIKENVRP